MQVKSARSFSSRESPQSESVDSLIDSFRCEGSVGGRRGKESTRGKEAGTRSAEGQESANTIGEKENARSAAEGPSASTIGEGTVARSCGGESICEHERQRSRCKECGGPGTFSHPPFKAFAHNRNLCLQAEGTFWAYLITVLAESLKSPPSFVSLRCLLIQTNVLPVSVQVHKPNLCGTHTQTVRVALKLRSLRRQPPILCRFAVF